MTKKTQSHLLNDDTEIIVFRLRSMGLTQHQIAAAFGVNQGTICRRLKRMAQDMSNFDGS